MIEELVIQVFKKAEKEINKKNKYGLSKHLEYVFKEDYKCYEGTSYKTLERYYLKHVKKINPEHADPKPPLQEVMSRYLGYKNYTDFVIQYEKEKIKEETIPIANNNLRDVLKKKIKNYKSKNERVLIVVLGTFILGMLSYNTFFQIDRNNTCMIWKKDHYEKASCDLRKHENNEDKIIIFDNNIYQKMRRQSLKEVEVKKSYYYKVDEDSIEFFSWYGKHPVNKEDLKPVSLYIYNKYVKPHLK